MSKITVSTMLAAILENNLQMDDIISFALSPEVKTYDLNDAEYDLNLISTETITIESFPEKTFQFIFNLSESEW